MSVQKHKAKQTIHASKKEQENNVRQMTTAHVLINCDMDYEQSIIEKLKPIEGVKEIRGILGAYDIIVKLECATNKRIREIITWKIRKIPQVRSTITLLDILESTPKD